MNTYTIIETRPALHTWKYEVTANSEQEAIELLQDMSKHHPNVVELDFYTESDYTNDVPEFYVESIKTK